MPVPWDYAWHHMTAVARMDAYRCVQGNGGDEIIMSEQLIEGARKYIDEMLRLDK